jgi:hypothetical protein
VDFIFIEGDAYLLICLSPTYFSFLYPLGGTGARQSKVVEVKLSETFSTLKSAGWKGKYFICDPEKSFNSNKQKIQNENMIFHPLSKKEHPYLSDTKCRVIKERYRLAKYNLPFQMCQKLSRYLALWVNSTLNMAPTKHNSGMTSPHIQFYGVKPDFNTHCSLSFGDFGDVSDPSDTRNSSRSRTFPGLALYPDHITGRWYYFDLSFGHKFPQLRLQCKPYPLIPKDYLKILNQMAKSDPVRKSEDVLLEESIYSSINESADYDLVEDDSEFQTQETPAYAPIQLSASKIQFMKNSSDDSVNMVQYNLNAGLKRFGDSGLKAIEKELRSVIEMGVIEGAYKSDLSLEESEGIIRSLSFMGEKSDGTVKARMCGNPTGVRKDILSLINTYSPTVNNHSLFITLDIAGSEGRFILMFDIGTAYLNAEMIRRVFMYLDKHTSQILCEISPEYSKFLQRDGRILTRVKKALYGCPESGRLWYDLVVEFLLSIGFKRNLKDRCVFNRDTPGGQLTILFHVDDFIATCKDPNEIQILHDQFVKRFKKVSFQWGPKYSFLGMEIEQISGKRISISMDKFINNLLESFPVPSTSRSTPVSDKIFVIDPDSELLSSEKREIFHSVVASCLYLSVKVRKDISVAVAFLSSRVQKPADDDMGKLTHLMQYIRTTSDRKLILGGESTQRIPRMYCDASYGVHSDGKSHSGISIHFNLGAVISKSIKQKIVSKSSTEAELNALSDGAALYSWMLQFLEEQGYANPSGIIYEDNEAAIILAKNGHPTSERTRHIRIRQFFISQFLESKEMQLVHCNTKRMVADILTKFIANPGFFNLVEVLMGYISHLN